MTSVSKLAFAALLATGATGVALTAPAAAKEKKDAAKDTGLKLSPAFIKVAKPAQDAVNAGDPAVAEPLVAAAEAAATTDDERYVAAQTRLVLESKKINARSTANPNAALDQSGLVKPLDALIANPRTPAADRGKYYGIRAKMAYQGKQYPVAIDYATKARDLGYVDPDLGLLLVRAKIDSGDVAGGTAELDREIAAKAAKGEKAPAEWYKFAISQANKRKATPQTVAWMNKYAAAYPSGQTWYEVLATYGLQQDSTAKLDNKQKLDLFRLMRASGGLPDQYFYMEYAQKAQDAGLPAEAQSVLKEGLANGKIPAANTEAKAMLAVASNSVKIDTPLATQETRANAAATGVAASQTGDAYLSAGSYAKAATLYQTALQKGGVDADAVNMHLGIALARSGDKAGAQAAFAAVKGEPRADIASLWTTWLGTSAA